MYSKRTPCIHKGGSLTIRMERENFILSRDLECMKKDLEGSKPVRPDAKEKEIGLSQEAPLQTSGLKKR